MKKRYFPLMILMIFLFAACGGRLPKPSTSEKIIHRYFKKYAKKYHTTEYGMAGVTKVEVESQTEIRKNFAAIEAFITLGDGNLKKIAVSVEKGPFGWRFVSWEDETGL